MPDKNNESFRFLTHANDKSEWTWHIYLKYILTNFVIGTLMTAFVSVVLSWFIKGQFNTKFVYRANKFMWVNLTINIVRCICFSLNTDQFDELTVCHGIKTHSSDTLVKLYFIRQTVLAILYLMVHFFCHSLPCAGIIRRSIQCFNIHCKHWTIWVMNAKRKSCYAIWFDFMLRLKSMNYILLLLKKNWDSFGENVHCFDCLQLVSWIGWSVSPVHTVSVGFVHDFYGLLSVPSRFGTINFVYFVVFL